MPEDEKDFQDHSFPLQSPEGHQPAFRVAVGTSFKILLRSDLAGGYQLIEEELAWVL